MSSFDLDTIRHAISTRMHQGRLALSNPSAIVAALATTALFSLLPEGTLSQPLLDSILRDIIGGGLGVSALYDFLKGFIDNLQPEEENQYTAEEIRQRFEQALRERLEESGQDARVLRADVSRLLQHVEGINVALSAAPSELRQPLVDSLIELGSNFEEFRWILIEQSQLLVEIRQRSKDMMSDVQRLVRQVARLEENQQALPAKLKLLLLLQSERPALTPLPPLPTLGEGESAGSPYKGLPAFQKEDAGDFFGREEQVADLIHQLAQDKRFLAVIGPSGSGKSSLVRAGLLSQLDSNTAHQLLHSRDWRTVIFKPGDHPIEALANSVGSLSINIGSRALLRGLQDSPDELARTIRQQLLHNQPLHVRLLLIVDQFEELFTRCRDESERNRFIESLLHVSQSTACRTIVLLTMRADFYGHCASHPRLRSQIQDHHLLVGPLHESELRRVIELPANKASLQLEPGLTETIIKDVADAPGALPLLSQALLETWKRRQDNTLTRSGYEASGGVQQAIAQTADKVYNEQLTSEQQAIARQIFLRLVELGESEQYDTRRRTSRNELGDGVSEVLLKLADARLIVTDQESVEVAHEALIREWPTLRNWLDEDREGLRIHRHLTEAAQEWENLGHDTGDLYRGARLAQAREWAEQHPSDLNALEQEFLQASQEAEEEARQRELEQARALAEEQRRRAEAERERAEAERERADTERNTRKRIGRFAMGLVIVALIAVGAAIYAGIQQREAERQTLVANAGQLAAQAQAVQEEFPQRSLLLAIEALQMTMREDEPRVPAAEQALRDVLANVGGIGLSGHESWINAVAISPNNHWLVTASGSKARLWDLTANDVAASSIVLTGHQDLISAIAISPDNHWLVTGSWDGTARLWDLTANDVAASSIVLTGHENGITEVAISPDNHWLVTGSWDKTARLWDLTGPVGAASPIVLTGHQDWISAVAISPDNHWLVTASGSKARLWDLTANDVAASPIVLTGHDGSITEVAISPDNHWLVTGSSDNTARLWDLTANDVAASSIVLTGHEWSIRAVAISPDNHWLVTGSSDNTARLWDLTANDVAASPIVLTGHESGITEVAISPNNHWLVTASGYYVNNSDDNSARLWDLTANDVAASSIVLAGHENGITEVAISPDNHWLVTGSEDNTARLWDLTANDVASPIVLTGHQDPINAVAISPDNHWLVTASSDNTARLWDLTANDVAASPIVLTGHESGITEVAISPNNHWLVTGSNDNSARLWDLTANDVAASSIVLTGHESGITEVAISPDNHWLVTASSDKTARLWDLTANDVAVSSIVLTGHESLISAIAISPDNHWLVTASGYDVDESDDNSARLWDLTANDVAASPIVLTRHQDWINAVAISPDNHWLVTASEDNSARLWDLTANDVAASPIVLTRHESRITEVAISPDNHWLVTASSDNTARLWNLRLDELIELACRTVGRNLTQKEWIQYFGEQEYRKTCAELPFHYSLIKILNKEGENLAKEGDIDGAIAKFRQALALGPTSELDPEVEARQLAAQALVERGEELAKEADVEGAIAQYQKALELEPSLELDPETEARQLAAPALVKIAKNLAKSGDIEGAIAKFQEALELEPSLQISPEVEARQLAAQALVHRGGELARAGDIEGAIAKFQEALELEPSLQISPEVEARQLAAQALVHRGGELAREGDIEAAIAQYQKALELEPILEIDPETEAHRFAANELITKGTTLAKQGQIEEAIVAYSEAQAILEPVPLIVPAKAWNTLCWFGSLWGYAADVMDACTHAVELASEEQIGPYRDSRGLARALTGDYAGAIEDFRLFVEWSKQNGEYEEDGPKREAWIAELEAGRNPFDVETLEALRNE